MEACRVCCSEMPARYDVNDETEALLDVARQHADVLDGRIRGGIVRGVGVRVRIEPSSFDGLLDMVIFWRCC